jgi:YD repeat-containing protein
MKYRFLYSMFMLLFLASSAFSASTSYVYDDLDRLHEVTLENGHKIIYEYDQIGNMISKNNNLLITTATPGGGTYTSSQTVTLSANEPATIYYTTDGTTPTTGSTVYSSPLPISVTTTLKYFAKDLAGNNEAVKIQTYIITSPCGVTVTSSTASPQPIATPITFTAAGSGGTGTYEYRFWLNSGTGYNIVQEYSASNTFVWTPAATGTNDILVEARNAGSSASRDAYTNVFYYQITSPATGVTIASSSSSPQSIGTPITFTATGQGGGGPYEYRFWLNSGTGYNIIQEYSASNTFVWTPAATGAYDILVDVRNAGSSAFRDAYTNVFYYQITSP